MMTLSVLLKGFLFLVAVKETVPAQEQTCALHDTIPNIFHLTLPSESPIGLINMAYIQFDASRGIPFTSTAMLNSLNHIDNTTRYNNFKRHDCHTESQATCQITFKMTEEQRNISNGRTAWDRGHLIPSEGSTYSSHANNNTFFCINIAPQEPYTNQVSWNAVETMVLRYFGERAGYVVTGTCSNPSIHSPTGEGYTIPDCYFKLACYTDDNGDTQVVGFLGSNDLIPRGDAELQAARTANTTTPRSQQEVISNLNANHFYLLTEAWVNAERYLLVNRNETGLPSGESCSLKRDLSEDVKNEWSRRMRMGIAELRLTDNDSMIVS